MNGDLMTLRNTMDYLLQDSFNRMQGRTNGNGEMDSQYVIPRVDAWENDEALIVEMALPGVDEESIDVLYEQDTLTVRGQFNREREGWQRIVRELPRGQFRRQFTVQVPIEADRIEATYEHGILTLHLPKSEQVRPRKIAVKAG